MNIEALNTGLLPFAARLLICAIFVQGAFGKIFGWSGQEQYMASHGMRFIAPLLAAALVIEVLGVLALLFGYQALVGDRHERCDRPNAIPQERGHYGRAAFDLGLWAGALGSGSAALESMILITCADTRSGPAPGRR